MNCSMFLKSLKDYIAGELPQAENELMADHMKNCEKCSEEYRNLKAAYEALQSVSYEGNIDFKSSEEEIMNNIDKSKYTGGFSGKLNRFLRSGFLRYAAGVLGTAAVIVFIFLTVNFFNGYSHNSVPAVKSDENNCKKTAVEFIKNLYTVDAGKITAYEQFVDFVTSSSKAAVESSGNSEGIVTLPQNLQEEAEKKQEALTENIRTLITDNAYKVMVSNRNDILNMKGCSENNCTMEVTEVILVQKFYDTKENDAGYNFEVKIKFISDKDNKEQSDTAKGYIGLKKEYGNWKINAYELQSKPELFNSKK